MKNTGITVDSSKRMPLYLQIAEQIKLSILNKSLPVGYKLSQRTIAEELGISRRPVAEALEMLEAEGLVETQPRSGTRVTNNVWLLINNNTQDTLWDKYVRSGRQKLSPPEVISAFNNMDDLECQKINGDKVSATFSPCEPFINVMDRVSTRLKQTEDMGIFSMDGLPSLKNNLCIHMEKYGLICSPEQIIVTSGIGESLSMICGAFLGPGMDFYHETPSFLNTIMLVQSTGANMHAIEMDGQGIDMAKLLPKLRRSKRSVVYVQPVNHNPTGIHTSSHRRTAVLAACKELGIPIIENDMFRDFYFDKEFPKPFKAFDNSGQVIYIGSLFSCFAGFKLSWIVAPDFILERLRDMKKHYELISNVLVEIFADEILSSGEYDRYFERIRPLMLQQYCKIEQLLDKYLSDIATWRRRSPAYFIWLKFNKDMRPIFSQEGIEEYLFFPGIIFDWKDTQHVRINTMGICYEGIDEWLQKISALVRRN